MRTKTEIEYNLSNYRRFCFDAVNDLLVGKPKETVKYYIKKVEEATNERQLSMIMADVRREL